MIYSIQTYLENYFDQCGLRDVDQYAVGLATLYDGQRRGRTPGAFLDAMRRIRTGFYKRNSQMQRPAFERRILSLLDRKFKKKVCSSSQTPSRRELRLQAIN